MSRAINKRERERMYCEQVRGRRLVLRPHRKLTRDLEPLESNHTEESESEE